MDTQPKTEKKSSKSTKAEQRDAEVKRDAERATADLITAIADNMERHPAPAPKRRDLTTTHGRIAYAIELIGDVGKKWRRRAARAKRGSVREMSEMMAERMEKFVADLHDDAKRLADAAKETK